MLTQGETSDRNHRNTHYGKSLNEVSNLAGTDDEERACSTSFSVRLSSLLCGAAQAHHHVVFLYPRFRPNLLLMIHIDDY